MFGQTGREVRNLRVPRIVGPPESEALGWGLLTMAVLQEAIRDSEGIHPSATILASAEDPELA